MNIVLLSVLWGLWYLNFSSRAVLSPLLPIIEQEFAIGHTAAGGIITFMSVGFTAALLLAGFASQRIGYKKSILWGVFILTASLFLMRFATTYFLFSSICLSIGFGAGIYIPCVIPILTEVFERRHWGKALAIHDSAASFGILSVPILTAMALRFFYWKTLFLILGSLSVLAILIFVKTCPDVASPQAGKRGKFRDLIPRKDFWIITLVWTLSVAATLAVYNIIPLFLVHERSVNLDAANTILGLSRIGGFFAGLTAGALTDRYGVKKMLVFLMAVIGIFTILLAFVRVFPLLVAILLLQATVSTAFFPVAFVAVSKLTTIEDRSIFMGSAIAFASAVGLGVATPLLGLIADLYDFQTGIAVLGFLVLLSCLPLRGFAKI